jgi:hypothetical protein
VRDAAGVSVLRGEREGARSGERLTEADKERRRCPVQPHWTLGLGGDYDYHPRIKCRSGGSCNYWPVKVDSREVTAQFPKRS